MITRGIRSFMARDWRSARRAKDDYWAERISRLGPEESFRIAEELRKQALMQNPGWPDAEERREDLLAHVRVTTLLRRAASASRD